MWFRVVTNKDGGIASCDLVEGQEHDGKGIFYVDAQTPAAACLAAKQLWLERYEKKRLRDQQLAAKRKDQGFCSSCKSRPARPNRVLCARCADSQKARRQALFAGAPSRYVPRVSSDTDKVRIAQERAHKAKVAEEQLRRHYCPPGSGRTAQEGFKLRILKETLDVFRRLSQPNAAPKFEGYLIAQIAELEGKTTARESIKKVREQRRQQKAQAAE